MTAEEALQLVNRIYARLAARRPSITTAENYYDGKQPLNFATAEWKKANAARYEGFSDNWCRPVVDAEAERLTHTGIKLPASAGKGAEVLWEQWLLNEMEMQSSQGFVTSLNASRSFVIVWVSRTSDEPMVTWEHPSSVEIEYDFENPLIRKAALKTWVDESKEYATLYTPEYLWKFERGLTTVPDVRDSQAEQAKDDSRIEGGWSPREPMGELWPLPNFIGEVPVVEIPNRPLLGHDPISETAGVMPMQDAINLLWAYLFLSADYASMPARVVTGQGPPMTPILDSAGKKVGDRAVDIKDLAEKRLTYLSSVDAKIDSWPAAKLDVFTDVIDQAVGHIAAQTRTPPTYLITKTGMSNVGADGLKASEIGLVKKTIEFQTFATPRLREVYRLIALAMGDKALAQSARLATIAWANPEIRSESQLADALVKKKSIGYPLEYLMEIDGLDPEAIKRVLAMKKAEEEAAVTFAASAAINDAINQDVSAV
jgi:hypothetical protein